MSSTYGVASQGTADNRRQVEGAGQRRGVTKGGGGGGGGGVTTNPGADSSGNAGSSRPCPPDLERRQVMFTNEHTGHKSAR